jgi:hypothetical protein
LTGDIANRLETNNDSSTGSVQSEREQKKTKTTNDAIGEKFGITLGLQKEKKISDGVEKGKVDFIFSSGSNKRSVVAIIEFGVDITQWWKKQHHILKYAQILPNGDKNYIFDKPILLIVVSVDTKDKLQKKRPLTDIDELSLIVEAIHANCTVPNEIEDNKQMVEETKLSVHTDKIFDNQEQCLARFGVFLCTPKSTKLLINWKIYTVMVLYMVTYVPITWCLVRTRVG